MSVQAILLPLFVQVALTFALLFRTAGLRTPLLRRGEVRHEEAALDSSVFPPRARQAAAAFSNQFEVPVLFYVLVILAMQTRQADLLFVVMSWLFVLSRLAHAFIHVGPNVLRYRGLAFAIGFAILFVMWVIFAVRLLLAI
jgi:hypothetical protein